MASKPKKAGAADEADDAEADGEAAASPKRKLSLKTDHHRGRRACRARRRRRGAYLHVFGGAQGSEAEAAAVKPAVFLDLPEVLVNLSNTGGERTQYLKVKIVLELADAEAGRRRSSR